MTGVLAEPFDEMTCLDEHAARAACRVEDDTVIRLNHVHDGLDERWRVKIPRCPARPALQTS